MATASGFSHAFFTAALAYSLERLSWEEEEQRAAIRSYQGGVRGAEMCLSASVPSLV